MKSMKKVLVFLILLLVLWMSEFSVFAKEQDTGGLATEVDPDMERRLENLSAVLAQKMEEFHIPGMALSIVQGDRILVSRGFGLADIENKTAATPQTLFMIGSVTKSFTAALASLLVDGKKMAWDDPITRYLPFLKLRIRNGPDSAQVTIRDLLAHRTGFSRMSHLYTRSSVSRRRILRQSVLAEPLVDFRQGFVYSNVMYLAAGTACAEAGGSSWERLLREEIFAPLGMHDSFASLRELPSRANMAQGYAWDEEQKRFRQSRLLSHENIGPAGSIVTNAVDMAQWLRCQLGRGAIQGRRLLSEKEHEETWTPQIAMGNGMSYGLGWMLGQWQGRRTVFHAGNLLGFSAQVAMLPDSRLGFVMLANTTDSTFLQASPEWVWEALLGSSGTSPAPPPAGNPGENLKKFLGKYYGEELKETLEIVMANGSLSLKLPNSVPMELMPPDSAGCRAFRNFPVIAVIFHENASGEAIGFTYREGPATLEYVRLKEAENSENPILDRLLDLRHADKVQARLECGDGIVMDGVVQLSQSGVSGRVHWVFWGGNRFLKRMDLGRFGRYLNVLDSANTWLQVPDGWIDEGRGRDLFQARSGHLAALIGDWRRYYKKILFLRNEIIGNRNTYVLELKVDDLSVVKAWVDAERGDVVAEERVVLDLKTGQRLIYYFRYADYRDVSGLRIPFSIISENSEVGRTVIRFRKIRIGRPSRKDRAAWNEKKERMGV